MAAPLAITGDVFQYTFVGLWHGQIVLNTFRYTLTSTTGAPTTVNITSGWVTKTTSAGQLVPTFMAACPPQYALTAIWGQRIAPTRVAKDVYLQAIFGGNIEPSNSANLAAVLQRRGALANKHNVGSLHVPYPNLNTLAANGQLDVAYKALITAIGSFVVANVTDAAVNVSEPVLFPNKTLDVTKVIPITQATAQGTIRTMRSRTVGHGK